MIKRRVYTKEFKIEAVEHTLDSTKTVKEISEDLGVHTIYYANGGARHIKKSFGHFFTKSTEKYNFMKYYKNKGNTECVQTGIPDVRCNLT